MNKIITRLLGLVMFIAASIEARAQGFVYDQQSATGPASPYGNDYFDIQPQTLTQSFMPTLLEIGFVQFEFADFSGNGNNGATVYIKLWTGSPNINSATFLGSTTPVYMPNGFGFPLAGVTNFYFLNPITLNPGQTYYLQPVVQSGDNPWDIMVLGDVAPYNDAYTKGQLYADGSSFDSNIDFWFREGILAVPEPSALALIGASIFFAIIYKRRSKLIVPLLFCICVLSLHAAGDSVVQVTADAAGLAPASAAQLPRAATIWVITSGATGKLTALPYPVLPSELSTLPIYSVSENAFIVDATGGQLAPASARKMSNAQAAHAAQTQAESMADLIDQIQLPTDDGSDGTNQYYQPDGGLTPMFYTNGLWLEDLKEDATNFWPRLHNTVGGDNYQLLSTTNLVKTNWDLGEILFNVADGYADFSPVPMTNSITFFRAHHANPVIQIQNGQNSEELNPTNSDPGHAGSIYIYDEGFATNDVTVYYTIGGTAQNGIDYSSIMGIATILLNQGYAEIDIDPIADGLKPNQTIIFTLLQNTNYLIDPAYYSATNTLYANPQVYPIARGDKQLICPNTSLQYRLVSADPRSLPLTYTILTWPAHGTLDTNSLPFVTYTPTNCYEGKDSFNFTASDGQYDSNPAAVTLTISDSVYANAVSAQVCRGAAVGFALDGGDCSGAPGYALLTSPAHGSVANVSGSATDPNYVYTCTGTNFTGVDSFNYVVFNGCGDTATNTVSVTVGDAALYATSQSLVTGTNRPVGVILGGGDGQDACAADTNDYIYTVTSQPANGTLGGVPPNLIYTPNANYEGVDSFQFTASDGVWAAGSPASVTIAVAAGPLLFHDCNPFGTGVLLDWTLDDADQQENLNIQSYIIYRSATGGSNYTAIATNGYTGDASSMSYLDTNAVVGQTNYYVVTFQAAGSSGLLVESPRSNAVKASGQSLHPLVPADAVWQVVTNLAAPASVTSLRAPFSSYGTNQYPGVYPLPNTLWPGATGSPTTWSNRITLFIPTNSVPLGG